ncbi:MAG: sulfatase, partial [Planctomycetes bacterium]|nr:sulfatase [Planctomycetota bacterium]
MARREFLGLTAAGAALAAASTSSSAADSAKPRPNILWLVCEDICPHLGCYGDTYAASPYIDQLAARGSTYLNVWSNAPVCAPARTAIITGMHPQSTGTEHMRSMTRLPGGMRMFPQFLRDAGYYCTNNAKEDYNLAKPGQVWDESSKNAHWKNRRPGQPFFAVFNHEVTHESGIRRRPHTLVHDPAKARVPAYHPDIPEVRHDWAQYYDNITTMDAQIGAKLKELADAGLAEDTIVFFYGDNGCGMPRGKRFPYDSGNHVPLIIHIPDKFRHLAPKDYAPGDKTDRLVSFIDLGPTVLSLAGVKPPDYMHGRAFMGEHEAPPHDYLYGFRGRMDERYDTIRSVRDKRYVYLRNYTPHVPHGQHVRYMFQTPTTAAWKKLYDEGKLTPQQAYFWQTKSPEELYDLQTDPDEVNNLANSPACQDVLHRLRKAQQSLSLEVRDIGFLPEAEIHSRSQGSSPYEVAHDDRRYPLKRIMATAEQASSLKPEALAELKKAFQDTDSAVRYWAAMGVLMRGQRAVESAHAELHKALADESPSVRIVAAHALGQFGSDADL